MILKETYHEYLTNMHVTKSNLKQWRADIRTAKKDYGLDSLEYNYIKSKVDMAKKYISIVQKVITKKDVTNSQINKLEELWKELGKQE